MIHVNLAVIRFVESVQKHVTHKLNNTNFAVFMFGVFFAVSVHNAMFKQTIAFEDCFVFLKM